MNCCKDCQWWLKADGAGNLTGECRVDPPQMAGMDYANATNIGYRSPDMQYASRRFDAREGLWPWTRNDAFCSRFQWR